MAYLLRKTATSASATVLISPRISHMVSSHASFTGDWELFIDCDVTASSFAALGLRGSGVRLLFFANLTTLRLARAAGNVDFTLPVSAAGRHEYRIVGSSATNTVEVFQDNVLCGIAPTNEFIEVGAMMEFGNSTRLGDIYRVTFKNNGVVTNDYLKESISSANDTVLPDTVGGNDGTLVNFPTDSSQWVFYDDGGGPDPQPELHEFLGSATVNALSFAQISKTAQHNGQALVNVSASGQFAKEVTLSGESLVTASASASSSKVFNTSGGATVASQSVSLFEKLNTFSGNASVNATSQSSASKLATFNRQATVNVIASASIIDGNFEIHSFSGGAVIKAGASGQAAKVGLVSGSANVTASVSTQASKTAQLSGNATVTTSTQSLFSKIASVTGNALTRVTTLASALKRVTLSGASRVFATAYGTFFNTESNVETYELTVQGRVKAPIVVQGTTKSLTIQGRVK